MSPALKHCIEALGVGALKPLHPGYKVWFRSFEEEMIVIGHQHIRMNPPASLGTNLLQSGKKKPPSIVILKYRLTVIAPAYCVIDCARIFMSH